MNESSQGVNTEFGMPSGEQVLEGLWWPSPIGGRGEGSPGAGTGSDIFPE